MKKLLEYYDIADLSNMRKKQEGGGEVGGREMGNLTMGRCSHHCYIVTCYMLH